MRNQEIREIKIKDLKLWSENPRDPLDIETSDFEIIKNAILNKNNKWDLNKLVSKIGDFYDFSELPTVVKVNGNYVVYDGNRRIAFIKYLQDEKNFNDSGVQIKHKNKGEFLGLIKIPCNVCDVEIALDNIERKHTGNGSWKELDREYFKHIHRGKEKSLFIKIEEETGLISKNPKLNQRFVREEVLTKSNLANIGLGLDNENNLFSNYDSDFTQELFTNITEVIETNEINTRSSRGKLKETLEKRNSNFIDKLKPFDNNSEKKRLSTIYQRNIKTVELEERTEIDGQDTEKSSIKSKNRTAVKPEEDLIFGGKLVLRAGKVNDLYRAIEFIYLNNKKNDIILPIIGMSLRLVLELTARTYYEEKEEDFKNQDQILSKFLRQAKKEILNNQQEINYLSMVKDWLDDTISLDGVLGKYAHGNIIVERGSILKNSIIVGQILEFYEGKK